MTIFEHEMLREIYQQPQALADTIERYAPKGKLAIDLFQPVAEALQSRARLVIAASGSSRHAGLAAEIMLEDLAGLITSNTRASTFTGRRTRSRIRVLPDAPLRGLYARHRVYESVRGIECFGAWLEHVERITESTLEEIYGEIPPEWYDHDADAIEKMLEQLLRRRKLVQELIVSAWKSSAQPFSELAVRLRDVELTRLFRFGGGAGPGSINVHCHSSCRLRLR